MKKYKGFNMKKTILLISILSLLLVLFVGCESAPAIQYTYIPPENISDGLEVSTLEEVNVDSELMEKLVNDINRDKYGEVHSLLIFKDDRLVLEEYSEGHKFQWDAPRAHGELVTWDYEMVHFAMSVTT
jgi:hypothetical protein